MTFDPGIDSIPESETDFRRHAYHFDLPADLIAQEPPLVREAARLLIVDGPENGGNLPKLAVPGARLGSVRDLPKLIAPTDLVVVNTSPVAAARFFAVRGSGGKVEVLVLALTEARGESRGKALLRAGRPIPAGETIFVAPLEDGPIRREIVVHGGPGPGGVREVEFVGGWLTRSLLDAIGVPPLPPYIKRDRDDPRLSTLDRERYQTVYADRAATDFSAAAPTAGLHFSQALLDELTAQGTEIVPIQLHVGLGTFSPLKVDDIRHHAMHEESFSLDPNTLARLIAQRRAGRPIISIGTTTARVLETLTRLGYIPAPADSQPISAPPPPISAPVERTPDGGLTGRTAIFVHPPQIPVGFEGLLTNFHLPESTLLMFVAARLGRERALALYRLAVAEGLRFFSYGDAMFVAPSAPYR